MKYFLITLVSIFAVDASADVSLGQNVNKPNIVLIIGEDMGPDLGCWGVDVHTPNIDSLASRGMRFTSLFGTASVCMPNRTAMITGVTHTALGAVTMRPPREFMRRLPGEVKPLPELMRQQGYFTANIRDKQLGSGGKDDWNFIWDGKSWDTKKLDKLSGQEPFYAQFNFPEAHRPFHSRDRHDSSDLPVVDPAKVKLPPYYPNHKVARESWAGYLESIQKLDQKVGKVLGWLEAEGVADRTIVFSFPTMAKPFCVGNVSFMTAA